VLDVVCRWRSAGRGREDPRQAAMVVVVVVVAGIVPAAPLHLRQRRAGSSPRTE